MEEVLQQILKNQISMMKFMEYQAQSVYFPKMSGLEDMIHQTKELIYATKGGDSIEESN